ncbi:MAG: fibronectin type III domain-containing protein [Gemmatimonadota bacterium]|nr:fibronectin type III domain-containing protein [Gemmatimonadota bacterium]
MTGLEGFGGTIALAVARGVRPAAGRLLVPGVLFLVLAVAEGAFADAQQPGGPEENAPVQGPLDETRDRLDERLSRPPANTTDATLSALTVETVGSASVTIRPAFHADSTSYRAFVRNDTASIIVTATRNDGNATVSIADDPDTSTPATATLALTEGANTVTVTVTAEDEVTTRTYTITVARAAGAPTADPEAVWTANLTVGVNGDSLGYNKAAGTGALAPRSFMVGDSTFTMSRLEYVPASESLPIEFEGWFLLSAILYLGEWGVTATLDDKVLDFRDGLPDLPAIDWAFGDVVLVKLFTNAPDKVTGVQVTSGNGQLEVMWDKPPAAEGYKIQWKSGSETFDDAPGDGREAIIDDEDTTSDTIPGLTNGTEYMIRVIATNNVGDGEPSDVASGVPLTTPGKVTGLTVTDGDGGLGLTWTRPSLAFGYKVQWKSGGQTFSNAATDNREDVLPKGDSTSHNITGLDNGTEYAVRVIATNAVADGPPSDEATGTPVSSDATLMALALATGGSASVSLSPVFHRDSTAYRVVVHNDTATVTVTATKNDDDATVVITDDPDATTPGTATLALSQGENAITVTVTAANTVTKRTYAITVVRARAAPMPDPSAAWTANLTVGTSDDGSGRLGYHAANGTGVLEPVSFQLNDTALTFNRFEYDPAQKRLQTGYVDLDIFTALYFFQRAGVVMHLGSVVLDLRDAVPSEIDLDWAFGDEVLLKLFTNVPEQVTGVEVTAGDGHLRVSWQKPRAAWGYKVQWKSGTESFANAEADGRQAILDHPDSTSRTISDLANGTEYMVRVIATNDAGEAASSDVKNGTPNAPVTGDLPWSATMTVGSTTGNTRGYDGTGGTLDDGDFVHDSETYQVTAVRLETSNGNLVLRVENQGTGPDSLPGALVWEVAGLELPLDEITTSASDGRYRYSQSWLATNAAFLHHTNVGRAVPVGAGVTVCLRTAMPDCPANTAATGQPQISGTPEVGVTLTASTGTITDGNGLVGATYGYQWFRVDDSDNETAVGTNSASYALVAADAGHTIKVRVSFLDAGGFGEMRTSEATSTVEAEPRGDPAVTLQPRQGEVTEGDTVRVLLLLDPVSASQLTVRMSWSQVGSFWAGTPPSSVTVAAGTAEVELEVRTIDDNTQEDNGSITARVLSGTGYEVSDDESVTTDVLDNDSPSGICRRTAQVRDRILLLLKHRHKYKGDCSGVTDAHLAKLKSLDVIEAGVTSLRTGDFAGLSNVTELSLSDNLLTALPAGVFNGLGSLEDLRLGDNRLSSSLTGVFVDLPALEKLTLYDNSLNDLPFDDLENLPSLAKLYWSGNPGYRYEVQVFPLRLNVGASDVQYRVRLKRPPGSSDAVEIARHAPGGVNVSPQSRTFADDNWFRSQTFTVGSTTAVGETRYVTHFVDAGSFRADGIDSVAVTKVAGMVGSSEAEDLALAAGLSPQEAAAVLFGEAELDSARLRALDRLGNGNGRYDHGDLIAWADRCRRGEAECGGSGDSGPGGNALPSKGRARSTGRRRRGGGDCAAGHPRDGSGTAPKGRMSGWGRAAFVVAMAAWACMGDDPTRPPADAPQPVRVDQPPAGLRGPHETARVLTVALTAPPPSRAASAMLRVDGPAIDSLRAPGLTIFTSGASSPGGRRVVVAGDLSAGILLEIRVPAGSDAADYSVEVLEVAGEDYALQDVAGYSASVFTPIRGR